LNVSLLSALRVVARADSDPTRTVLFESLAARSPLVRLARRLTQGPLRGRLPSVLAIALYGTYTARVCLAAPHAAPVWALALFENDRRQIDRVREWVGADRVAYSPSGLHLAIAASRALPSALRGGRVLRYLRCVGRLCRRFGFLVSCRTASALACAMVAGGALRHPGPRAVLVSSDYNAEAVGLVHAGRRTGMATIYVAHAPTHHLSPPLHFTLAVLDGEAALDVYRRKGPVRARCVYKGVEGREAPLDPEALARPRPVIGLFLPKEVNWQAFRQLVTEARRTLAPARILVRWHPNAQDRPALRDVLDDASGVESRPAVASLDEDARDCDWVVADRNSSVPLTALKAGVPVLVVPGLAVFPGEQTDLYGLVADRVVPPPCASFAATPPESQVAFYRSGWRDRFRRHDGSYERPPEAVARDVREAVLEVAAGASPTASA
jgi:hypothetical protein